MIIKTTFTAGSSLALIITIGLSIARGQSQSEVQAGLAAHPISVPLNLRGLNLEWVARGSYIVNASAVCTSCHTVGARYLSGGNPFLGESAIYNTVEFLGGKRSFAGGTIVSRNLTPDVDGRPGGLTLNQFHRDHEDWEGPEGPLAINAFPGQRLAPDHAVAGLSSSD